MGYRTWARAIVLGWLAAEWIGILIAYSFAVLVLTFFLGLLLVTVLTAGAWLAPLLGVVAVVGLLLAWSATAIPREMLRRARPPRPIVVPPVPVMLSAWGDPPPRTSRWEVGTLLSRMTAVEETERTPPNRAVSARGPLDRYLPALSRTAPDTAPTPLPIPPLDRIGVTSSSPLRIVDLSEPRPRPDTEALLRAAFVRTRENPGRIRQA